MLRSKRTAILLLVLCVTLGLILNNYSLQMQITESMHPLINTGDVVIFKKSGFNDLKRFEVIAYRYKFDDQEHVGFTRVVGFPLEKISISDEIKINEKSIEIPPTIPKYQLGTELSKYKHSIDIELPEKKYFVLGDNVELAHDSRYFGYIDQTDILGKVVGILKFPNQDMKTRGN